MNTFKKHSSMRVILLILSIILFFTFSTTAFAIDKNGEIDIIKHYILNNYVNPVDIDYSNIEDPKDIFQKLDKHSSYYDEKDFNDFMDSIMGEFVGIGIYIGQQDGYVVITQPIKGAPAESAGLLSGDKIMFVDGKNMKGLPTDEVVSNIKGPIGTDVKIGVERDDKILYFTITRDTVVINPIEVEVIDNVGYIKISQFNEHTSTNFLNAMGELYFKNLDKLIIDLRDNPGGSLEEVASVSRLLIPKGPIVHIDYKNHRQTYISLLRRVMFKNLVVLVNENSASASEILAGAVQDTGVGTIIGKPTYGKGSVQRIYFLPSGTGFKITEALYRTPSGIKIDGIGVTPDIEVDRFSKDINMDNMDTKTLLTREYDQQLKLAIEYLNRDFTK